ncbi:DoxX family protein [Kitasatospora sp. NPDC059747]|uniref:DoxX family protein n=1 Tax=Kitasatospora sp. NPDC059747 TaxID=3346930 RepID=UPI003660048D
MVDHLQARFAGPVQSVFRVVAGLLFACHGTASLFGFFGGAAGTHGGTLHLGAWPGWWAAAIQLAGGALVLLGLFTRPAAMICSGSMAYAYFVVHQHHGLLPIENGGELSALYCWIFLLIATLGPGPWAVDEVLRSGRIQQTAESGAERSAVAG